MYNIIEYKLNETLLADEYEYFFTFLTDRFEHVNSIWVGALEKRFHKKFKPIHVLSAKQNNYFSKDNFIIINKILKGLKEKMQKDGIIYLQDYEDLNSEFCESNFVKDIVTKMINKQGRVFILGFTSSQINFADPRIIVLGPKPEITNLYDSKAEQVKLFQKLDLPRNRSEIYSSIESIKAKKTFPFYISAEFTSGGHESSVIYTERDLDSFHAKLRKINANGPFIVADLIIDIALSPNVNALASDKKTTIVCITDQILRGVQYLGNVYPSKVIGSVRDKIIETTQRVGDYLAKRGFRGLFGLDFIVNSKGELFTVDLNPRRQGGYLCNVLMSNKVNLIEKELALALGEPIGDINSEDFEVDFAWAHSKIKPYYNNMRIRNAYYEGSPHLPFGTRGSQFKCIYYPQGGLLTEGNAGYFITSGDTYQEVVERTLREVETAISKDFELYEGI